MSYADKEHCIEERHYYGTEIPKVRKAIEDFKEEVGVWGVVWRWLFLQDRYFEVKERLNRHLTMFKDMIEYDAGYIERALCRDWIAEDKKELKLIDKEINIRFSEIKSMVDGKVIKKEITEDMIEQAKQYPIKSLLNTTKDVSRCPFHDDRSPSLNIKNNWFYCHACGAKGNAINLAQKIYGLNFVEAVKFLVES